jgi:hypothetical protein
MSIEQVSQWPIQYFANLMQSVKGLGMIYEELRPDRRYSTRRIGSIEQCATEFCRAYVRDRRFYHDGARVFLNKVEGSATNSTCSRVNLAVNNGAERALPPNAFAAAKQAAG